MLKCQQRQLNLKRHKIKSYEGEPVKKLKLLNLDECAKKLAFQKDNYDTNVNIMLELITTEDSDNYDQEESDSFEVQQEFDQLTISLTDYRVSEKPTHIACCHERRYRD